MILIGMFDSPFVRRVAISMELTGLRFEHRDWSVGRDQAQIRQYNPLGRVPALVLDDGEVLSESAMLLDYIDQQVGPERALLPTAGPARRKALHCMALAMGACEKGVASIYERLFRPAEKVHQPWLDRLTEQMHGALGELNTHCGGLAEEQWLLGASLSQADISAACAATFLSDALGFELADRYPSLAKLTAQAEALAAFKAYRVPFFKPGPPN